MVEDMLAYYLEKKYGIARDWIRDPYLFVDQGGMLGIDYGIDQVFRVDESELLAWAINYGRMLDR